MYTILNVLIINEKNCFMLSPENKDRLKKYLPKIMLWKTDKALDLTLEERQEIFDIIKTVEPGLKISWYCSLS